jgi:long-chain acyl-CoA synthetase
MPGLKKENQILSIYEYVKRIRNAIIINMEPKRTFDLLDRTQALYSDKPDILAGKEKDLWVKYDTDSFINHCNWVSYALLALGIEKGDRIAIVANNRPELIFTDLGISQTGAISIPVYPTISADEYNYILNHAAPKFIFVSDKNLLEKIKPIAEKSDKILEVYTFNLVDGAKHFSEILELGKSKADELKMQLEMVKACIDTNDLATIIYTSGTTGFPKGAMLRHSNLISNCIETTHVHPLNYGSKELSFLPLSHILERMMTYHFIYKGIGIYYAENTGMLMDNMKEVKPDIFVSVPRLLEKIYDNIIRKGRELKGVKKQIFFWAVNLGLRYELNGKNGWFYEKQLILANKLIFSKWREALGGNIKIIVSGGAALQPRLARIFWAAQIMIIEGYGLTETSPVIAVNNVTTMEVNFGTVGPILKDIEVKIADDGEILSKGPNIMAGYYKDETLTAEVIDNEGWFHTGDVGEMVDGKYLKITDRKKELFKLSNGKYIAPQSIENKLKESTLIEQVMVIGSNQKFASAIVVPNFQNLHNWASMHQISFQDNNDLILNPLVVTKYQKEVDAINKQLGDFEHIKRFRLVPDEWTMQNGELSPTLKLKRNLLHNRYNELIEEIFSVDKSMIIK